MANTAGIDVNRSRIEGSQLESEIAANDAHEVVDAPAIALVDSAAEQRPRAALTGASLSMTSPLAPAVARNAQPRLQPAASGPGPKETEARQRLAAIEQRAAAANSARNAIATTATNVMGGTTAQHADRTFDGVSQTEATQVAANIARLQTLSTELAAKIKEVSGNMSPNFFERALGDGFYSSRLNKLRGAEIRVSRDSELYRLLAPQGAGRSIDVSYDQMLTAIDNLTKSTAASANALAQANAAATQNATQLSQRAAALRTSAEGLADSPFALPQIAATTVPAIDARIAQLRTSAARDPLAAARNTAIAATIAQNEKLVKTMREGSAALNTEVPRTNEALTKAGLRTAWIGTELRAIATQGGEIATRGANSDVSAAVEQLNGRIATLRQRMTRALAVDEARRVSEPAAITETESLVETTRKQLAPRVGVDARAILAEEQFAPADAISRARQQLTVMRDALNEGNVDGAEKARDAGRAAIAQARGLVTEASTSVAGHAKNVQAQRARQADLSRTATQREPVVSQLENTYAQGLSAPARQTLNGSVEALEDVQERIGAANTAFGRGAVIGASRALTETSATLDSIAQNLDSIVATQRGLAATDASNAQALAQVESELARVQSAAADRRTRSQARSEVQGAARFLGEIRTALGARGRDPNELRKSIDEAIGVVRNANVAIQNDWNLYAQADNAIDSVNNVLVARALFRRNSSFAGEYLLWQTAIGSMRGMLASGQYEAVIQQAEFTKSAIIAAAIAVENAEREEEERRAAEERARRRAEEEAEQRRRDAEEERRRSSSGSGTGLPPSSSSGSGTGLPPSSSSGSGTGLSSGRKGSGTGL